MKIIFDNGGQTCNKFWSYLPILASCIEKKQKAISINYFKEIEDYPNLLNNPYLKFPIYHSFKNKKITKFCCSLIIHLIKNKLWNSQRFLCKNYENYFVNAWDLIDIDIDSKILERSKKYFLPSLKIQKEVQYDISLNKKDSILIGVHCRRTDYKYWQEGRYYYEFAQYANCCKAIEKFLDERVTFLICSDENIDLNAFEGLDVFKLSNCSSTHDLYALSLCDYIIGPPSTFSTWAALIGGKLHSFIFSPDNFIPNFKRLISHSKYEGGDSIIYS